MLHEPKRRLGDQDENHTPLEVVERSDRRPVNNPGGGIVHVGSAPVRGFVSVRRGAPFDREIVRVPLDDSDAYFASALAESVATDGRILGVSAGSEGAALVEADLSSARLIRPDYPDAVLVRGVFSEPYRE